MRAVPVVIAGLIAVLSVCADSAAAAKTQSWRERVSNAVIEGRPWVALARAEQAAQRQSLSAEERAEAARRAGDLRLRVGDYFGAERDYRLALDAGSRADVMLRLAQVARDRPQEALDWANKAAAAAQTAPLRSEALRLAGEIDLDLGDQAGARELFARALESQPRDIDALEAVARLDRAQPNQAAVVAARADQAAASAPRWDRADAWRAAGRIWLELGDDRRAASAFEQALAADPDDIDALQALFAIKMRRPDISVAVKPAEDEADVHPKEAEVLSTLAASPFDLESLRNLAEIKLQQGRKPEAVAAAERLTDAISEATPWQQAAAFRLAARQWLALGDARRARYCVERAFDLEPTSLESLRIDAEIGDRARQKAKRLNPIPLVQDVYAEIIQDWSMLGDHARAVAAYQDAVRAVRGRPEALSRLASARPRD